MRNRPTFLGLHGPAFLPGLVYGAMVLIIVLLRGLSLLIPGSILAMCVMTFVAYAWDKRRAVEGGRRLREATLHTLEAMGGWPGALAAQSILRHKNRKRSYQIVFRVIAVVNICATLWLILKVG